MPRKLANEKDDLWNLILPSLKGKWRRLEAATPPGMPDCVGLWSGSTWWLEMKIGKPSMSAMLPSQVDFACDCMRHGVPYWTVFGHKGNALYFRDLNFSRGSVPPFVASVPRP